MRIETLGTVANYINGRAFKPAEWETVGLPIIRIQNLNDPSAKYNYSTANFEERYKIHKGDLLYAWSASLGAHIWKGNDAWLNQHIYHVIPRDDINQKYLYYFLCKITIELYSKTHGTGMVHITKDLFMATEIPVPSLPEQFRIVARIEELFSDLDKAVETLQKTKQQLAVYRQAVLKEAFVGELTSHWRAENSTMTADEMLKVIYEQNHVIGFKKMIEEIDLPNLPKSWAWVSIGDISIGAEYGTSKKSLKQGKCPVLRMGNIQNGRVNWGDLVYSSNQEEIQHYKLHVGDVLFNRTNSPELVGKTAVYKGEQPAIFAGYLIRVNQVKEIDSNYLSYYLNGEIAKKYGNKVKTYGVNQSNINSQKLYSFPFPLCSLEEQRQVSLELDRCMSVCDNIEQAVNKSLQQAASLRQSILKEAFEGRLV